MSGSTRLAALAAVAIAGATAVVAAELAAIALSVRLAAAAVDGWLPASASSLPIVAVAAATAGLAVVVSRRAEHGERPTAAGTALVAVAPVTAFGGGCGVAGQGGALFRSGVRIGVAADGCVTFLNGALLVLGYGLLSAGLWVAAGNLAGDGITESAQTSD